VHVAEGLVDQVQVEIVQAEPRQRRVDGFLRARVAGVLDPQLGGHEQVAARHAARRDALADSRLVHIGRRGIDQAVAGADGVDDAALALGRVGNLEDAVAQQGHAGAVVQCDMVHLVSFRARVR